MDARTHTRFIAGGLRFFVFAWIAAFLLLLMAPIAVVRLLCIVALAGATAGVLLHLLALRAADRGAFDALRGRPAEFARQARILARSAGVAMRTTAQSTLASLWPGQCVVDGDDRQSPTPLSAGIAFHPPW